MPDQRAGEHEHVWTFKFTSENWFDGDETDIYVCAIEGCEARDRRYVGR